MLAAYANKEGQIRGLVKDMVSTYHPEGERMVAERKSK